MATNSASKDTIYVDIDDEITTIIDKVRHSEARVIALVLPKRATVFQSIVNMKLLKRSAEGAKKHVVLVTTESSLMPLAGTVGLLVAETPQSKPEIPALTGAAAVAPDELITATEPSPEEVGEGYTADNAGDRPVGELAGSGIETVSLPDDETEEGDGTSGGAAAPAVAKEKHLKVPNFNKFRLRLFAGILLLILLIVGLYLALAVLPKATIAIATNATNANVSLTMTLDPSAQSLDTTHMIVPAKSEQQQQTTTQQVATTGQKNNGKAASGSITMTAQECAPNLGQPPAVPSGTGVSANGLTYITQGDTTFPPFGSGHGSCVTYTATNPTDITAQSPGVKYNTNGSVNFTVAGRSDISASGSASGGTDSIIQVVAQSDIDSAKQKLSSQNTSTIKATLEQSLRQDGLYPIVATYNAGAPTITSSSNVGDQASSVTVTQAITYTMYGAKQNDLQTLINNNINSQINTANQSILDDGLAGANFGIAGTSGNRVQLSLQTTALVGPDISVANVKKEAAGKKSGDIVALLTNQPGVKGVAVHLSPFWVSSVPSNTSKITVTIGKAQARSNGSG